MTALLQIYDWLTVHVICDRILKINQYLKVN